MKQPHIMPNSRWLTRAAIAVLAGLNVWLAVECLLASAHRKLPPPTGNATIAPDSLDRLKADIAALESELRAARMTVRSRTIAARTTQGESSYDLYADWQSHLLSNPKLQHFTMLDAGRLVERVYGPILPELNLTPGETRQLRVLLALKTNGSLDAALLAHQAGLSGVGETNILQAAATADIEGEIKRLLGAERAKALRDFTMKSSFRNFADDFRDLLEYHGLPQLDDGQYAALLSARTASHRTWLVDPHSAPEETMRGIESELSSGQRELLARILSAESAATEIRRQISRASSSNGG
jgi:hypothetical protein